MAAVQKESKDDKMGRSFKERLKELCYPYIHDGADNSWILDLVFSPGEPRLQLLYWLFSKYDSTLNVMLEQTLNPSESRIDSRVQRLLYIASMLGLCQLTDTDLIRGDRQGSVQIAFMNRLVDWVLVKEQAENPHHFLSSYSCSRHLGDTSHNSNSSRNHRSSVLRKEFDSSCLFIDSIASNQSKVDLFATHVSLIPPDIMKELQLNATTLQRAPDTNKKSLSAVSTVAAITSPPDLDRLKEDASNLTHALQRQNDMLAQLKKTHQMPAVADERYVSETLASTIRLVLSDLDQLILTLSCCLENDMMHWCKKKSQQGAIGGLAGGRGEEARQQGGRLQGGAGLSFKRVYAMLQEFMALVSSLQTTRCCYTTLTTDLRVQVETLRKDLAHISSSSDKPRHANSSTSDVFMHSDHLIDSLQSSASILEQSISLYKNNMTLLDSTTRNDNNSTRLPERH